MTYSVKEIYYTLQGEGARTGRAAVFLRFAGCNLWSGRERHRAQAICRFCDTDFVGSEGGKFATADALADAAAACWPGLLSESQHKEQPKSSAATPYVVCTGGEPLLQLDAAAIAALRARGFEIAVESNGTIAAPPGIDWLCISPKAAAPLQQRSGQELKLVYPQAEAEAQPERFAALPFAHFFLQPLHDDNIVEHTRMAVEYCLAHPQWRLSLQTHKIIGID